MGLGVRMLFIYYKKTVCEIPTVWWPHRAFDLKLTCKELISQALVLSSWMLFSHSSISYLNAKNNFYLFKFYFKLTQETPAKCEGDHRVAGLSAAETKKFWLAEKLFNHLYYRVLRLSLYPVYAIYCSQFFFVQFEVNSIIFLLTQTLHGIVTSYFIYLCLTSMYTLNLFYVQSMRFFDRRFSSISKQLQRMGRSKTKGINKKLFRLLCEHTAVHFELIQINNFFKARPFKAFNANTLDNYESRSYYPISLSPQHFNFFNLIHYFLFSILLTFSALEADFRLKLAVLAVLCAMYFLIIYAPCAFANSLSSEVSHLIRISLKFKFEQMRRLSFHTEDKPKSTPIREHIFQAYRFPAEQANDQFDQIPE